MAGTPLDPADPYIPAGLREYLFVPDGGIANLAAPTRIELDTGTNLTTGVVDYAGWVLPAQFVDDVGLGSRVVGKIEGLIDPGESTLTFKASKTSTDIRQVLPAGTKGTMVVFPEGDGPANGGDGTLMDLWPVTVGSEGMDGGISDRAQRLVSFATGVPVTGVTIPPIA